MRKVKTRKSIKKEDYEDLIYYKLKNSAFKQQRLPAWRPVPTFWTIIIFYLVFAIVFITLGIIILINSAKIVEFVIYYDNICTKRGKTKNCTINRLTIPKDMKAPIMIYYQINGFFQNHRRYLKSKNQKQLSGKEIEKDNAGDCYPITTNRDMGFKQSKTSVNHKTLDLDEVAYPCGLMAKTYFNDSFSNWKINDIDITINEKNIAWDKDKTLFKNANLSKQWIDVENEHFIVWMRAYGLPNTKKLWGRIEDRDIKANDNLTLQVDINYNVSHFGGSKRLILSTTNFLGGKNEFLGYCFIIVGGISLLLGIAFPFFNLSTKEKKNENENERKYI